MNGLGQNLTGVAAIDLGLGSNLSSQVQDETEEEKRRKRLGLSVTQSPAAQMLLGTGYGSAGKV